MTISQNWFCRGLLLTACAAMSMTAAYPAMAQTADDEEDIEEVLVTGSRIRRDSFTSAAPIQVFDVDAARQIGVTSISELLQRSTIANGQQINASQNTNAGNSNASEPPPAGGVGSASIALRGLEPERTLVLINGRRLGSAGVRGAPSQPDINLLPLSLVDRIEVITEGASSIYGADAVAGVVNILLRNEFEGFEVSTDVEFPTSSGGESYQFSMITGASTDRSKIVFAAEVFERRRLKVSDRRKCIESLVKDADTGERLPKFCSLGFFDNVIYSFSSALPGGTPTNSDWFFATPGETDVGVPNFSSALALPLPTAPGSASRRADQRGRFPFIEFYSGQQDRLRGDLVQPITRFSTVVLGSYEPQWFGGDEELYYEAYYFNRHAVARGGIEQIFPTIQGMIPEVDASGTIIGMADNPLNPFPGDAIPIITLDSLNQDREVEVQQFRIVGGIRGDIPAFAERNWSYDFFASYDRGTGFVSQPLLSETQLALTTNTLRLQPDGSVTCGIPLNDVFGFITQQECVPVDFFAPSIYVNSSTTTGDFATREETDFLIGVRTNRTVVEQLMFGGYLTGDLFDLPTGTTVGTAFGGEFRKDSIFSAADFLSSNALNAGENPLSEGNTSGNRDIFDLYAEVNVPIIQGAEMAEYIGVEGAIRYTDESNFGSEITTRARFIYSPNDWITVSGSYGTSFRAPNLREQFLGEQFQGISSDADPCVVPDEANDGGVYNPAQDNRSAQLLDNCRLSGADPTQLGLIANINVPVVVSGNSDTLSAETSRTFTATLSISPPISDQFEVDFAISYWDIEVEDNIRSVNAATILTRCFQGEANLASNFCALLTRTQTGPETFRFISLINASFVNIGLETAKGIDINGRFRTRLSDFMGGPLDIGWAGTLTIQTERKERIFAEDPLENLLADFGNPKRRFTSTVSLVKDNFEVLLSTRHLSGTTASDNIRLSAECDVPDDALNRVGPNSVLPICDAGGRWYQDVSLTWSADPFIFTAGLNNLFDTKPPKISIGAGSNRANLVTSSGYDQFGRTVFFSATAAF